MDGTQHSNDQVGRFSIRMMGNIFGVNRFSSSIEEAIFGHEQTKHGREETSRWSKSRRLRYESATNGCRTVRSNIQPPLSNVRELLTIESGKEVALAVTSIFERVLPMGSVEVAAAEKHA